MKLSRFLIDLSLVALCLLWCGREELVDRVEQGLAAAVPEEPVPPEPEEGAPADWGDGEPSFASLELGSQPRLAPARD